MSQLNNRREFMASTGMSFGSVAMGALLADDGIVKGANQEQGKFQIL